MKTQKGYFRTLQHKHVKNYKTFLKIQCIHRNNGLKKKNIVLKLVQY